MGKKDKKQRHQPRASSYYTNGDEEEEAGGFIYPQDLPNKEQEPDPDDDLEAEEEEEEEVEEEEGKDREKRVSGDTPSKFLLYQQSVQSPKGDISYLQKLFLMYVGGRAPLHLQEDFCGTALLSAEWLRSDSKRTAVGVDFDLEALNWCMENNINKVGADGYSRIFLYHGNVLQPSEAKLIKTDPQELIIDIQLKEYEGDREADPDSTQDKDGKRNCLPPARDIVCAFNYSCCCLHKRADLILYFKRVLTALSKKGGIFVMDLYGGSSSEHGLKLQRKFPNFTYVWEQAEFNIIERKTRISLHFFAEAAEENPPCIFLQLEAVVAPRTQGLLGRGRVPICPFLVPADARYRDEQKNRRLRCLQLHEHRQLRTPGLSLQFFIVEA